MSDSTTTKPKTIFKYQPINVQSLANLQSQSIYFCSPSQFNDPYDCAITTKLKKLTHSEARIIKKFWQDDLDDNSKEAKELQGMSRAQLKEFCEHCLTTINEEGRQRFVNESGVACFTERKDSILMWSHYADRGRGMCLEFDTNFEPMTKIRKVKYVEKVPEISGLPMLIGNDFDQFIDLFCTKSIDWSYEKEWRSLHKIACTHGYEKEALKAIYFGPGVNVSSSNIVSLILHGQNPSVKLYQGKIIQNEFKVEFTPVQYIAPNKAVKKQ